MKQRGIFSIIISTMTLIAISVMLLPFCYIPKFASSQLQVLPNVQQNEEDAQAGNSSEVAEDESIMVTGQYTANSS